MRQDHSSSCQARVASAAQRVLGWPRATAASACRYVESGAPVRSFDALRRVMEGNGFALAAEEDLPFVIREHSRKFQWGVAHGSAWVKADA
jgi:hypothetical protein